MKTLTKNTRAFALNRASQNCYESYKRKLPFTPPKLPYSYSALNIISESENLKNHFFSYHMKGFEDFLELINGSEAENMGICQIFEKEYQFDNHLIESACIVFNHQLFWDNLCPYCGEISFELGNAIKNDFGDFFNLKKVLVDVGSKMNSNGWLWIIINKATNKLQVVCTVNNENTLQNRAVVKGAPILAIDLWEHAFINKFNKKEDYINAVLSIVNWSQVSSRFRFIM